MKNLLEKYLMYSFFKAHTIKMIIVIIIHQIINQSENFSSDIHRYSLSKFQRLSTAIEIMRLLRKSVNFVEKIILNIKYKSFDLVMDNFKLNNIQIKLLLLQQEIVEFQNF
ncbi:unnamed protein product [Paramecium sonneborni]|uniref:Uncharacterized protein n=1 Tax=Paramecium sonneborni TaxID=65129 RepID=A0A8S1NCG3_9CILI|nr:unnamed protein product [Paramecium sonneborni]